MTSRSWVIAAVARTAAWPAAAQAAPPLTADYTAADISSTNHQWYVTGTTVTTSTVAARGTVTFNSPTGTSRHDVIFPATSPKPAECTPALTTNAQGSFVPAAGPTAPGWTASCRFDSPGTYDPSSTSNGHLLNGSYVMLQALQVRATNTANPATTSAPLTSPVTLLGWNGPVSNDNVTVSFKQPIAPTDPLRSGQHAKTVVFTLSSSTP